MPRALRVFLCHSSKDKPAVRELYQKLRAETWIDPWLDEEKLFPGQDWHEEIEKAVEATDVVVVLLSKQSVSQEGYVQRELKLALDVADEKPENTIFIIPLRLDDCPAPRRLRGWHYVDYFPANRKDWVLDRLIASLKLRAKALGIENITNDVENRKPDDAKQAEFARLALEARGKLERETAEEKAIEKFKSARKAVIEKEEREAKRKRQQGFITANSRQLAIGGIILIGILGVLFTGNYLFNNLPAIEKPIVTSSITLEPPTFIATNSPALIATKIPVTSTFTSIPPTSALGIGSTIISEKDGMFLAYVPEGEFVMGSNDGSNDERPAHTIFLDSFWIDQNEVTNEMYKICVDEGVCNLPLVASRYYNLDYFDHPVVNVDWSRANAYCSWAGRRLPTEAEWEKAASWDEVKDQKYIYPGGNSLDCSRANYGCIHDTTPVRSYEGGKSSYGVFDMAGNVWEWVSSIYVPYPYDANDGRENLSSKVDRVLRGGAWDGAVRSADRNYLQFIASNIYSNTNPKPEAFPPYLFIGFRCAYSP